MKYTIITLISFLFFTNMPLSRELGEPAWRIISSTNIYRNMFLNFISDDGDTVAITSEISHENASGNIMTIYDGRGNIKWQNKQSYIGYVNVQIMENGKHIIAELLRMKQCSETMCSYSLVKYDNNGDVAWEHDASRRYSSYNIICPYSENMISVPMGGEGDTDLIYLDHNGNEIWRFVTDSMLVS